MLLRLLMRVALQCTLSMHALRSRRAGSDSGYSTRISNSSLTLREGVGGGRWGEGKGVGGRIWEGGYRRRCGRGGMEGCTGRCGRESVGGNTQEEKDKEGRMRGRRRERKDEGG